MGRFGDDPVQLVHFRRAPDNAAESLFGLYFFTQQAVLSLEFQMVGYALQQQLQFIHAEGLGDVVISTVFHSVHGGLNGAVAGHNHHDSIGALLLDLVQRFQASGAGQLEVQQYGINVLRFQNAVCVFGRIGHEAVVAQRLRYLAAGFANGAFVIHDQEIQKIGSLDLGCARQSGFRSRHDHSLSVFPLGILSSSTSRSFLASSLPVNGFRNSTIDSFESSVLCLWL